MMLGQCMHSILLKLEIMPRMEQNMGWLEQPPQAVDRNALVLK
jgi:hypothetical protein